MQVCALGTHVRGWGTGGVGDLSRTLAGTQVLLRAMPRLCRRCTAPATVADPWAPALHALVLPASTCGW